MLKLFVIGLAMGAAEVVPGVSGGTIAFVTGIYERLVNGLRHFTPMLLVALKNDGIKATWARVDGTFLLVLFAGMAVSLVVFAGGVSWLLVHRPVMIWSFFGGLVIASVWLVYRQISRFGVDLMIATLLGAAVGGLVTTLVPINLPPTPLYLFCGGVVAVCAWILPGISGSFILLLLGLYAYVINAVHQLDLSTLAILATGCVVGLVAFSQVLSRLFRHHRDETLAVLTGFMIGSLVKLWPWKSTVSYQLQPDGSHIPLVQDPVSPHIYTSMTGQDPQIAMAIVSAIAGIVLVLVIEWLASESVRDSVK